MNLNINLSKLGRFVLAGAVLVAQGCLKDFEEINTNPLNPNEAQKNYDGVASGGYFTDFQKRVTPTRSAGENTDRPNEYQVAFNLAADNWAGYFSPMSNKFHNGNNFTTYYMIEGWVNYTYGTMFTNIINPWFEIKQQTHNKKVDSDGKVTFEKKNLVDQSVFSIAQIIKIQALHKTTDMFGPLPYSQIGGGDLFVAYDSQESIYKSFFAELQTAVETLNQYSKTKSTLLEDYDGVYHGDVKKWMKLGNSLMLRLAMRVRYADENLAREYATKATTNPGGLIESVDDIAMLKTAGRFSYLNSIKLLWDGYSDCRMGATIYSYLKGFNDPRLASYFKKGKTSKSSSREDYYAVRTGVPMQSSNDFYMTYSVPNIEDETPTYWVKASEVYFLRAEAALVGLLSGNAEMFYKKGVETSFEENNLKMGTYLETSGSSTSYEDPKNSSYAALAPSSISKKWSDVSSQEEHLEQIITQKYIAIYPDGQEAWSEWRRTGYPKQITAFENRTNQGVRNSDGYSGGVRRFPFPQSEINQNGENVSKAIQLLDGADNSATKVWWDKNPKIQ